MVEASRQKGNNKSAEIESLKVHLSLLRKIHSLVFAETDIAQLLVEVCRLLVQERGYSHAYVGLENKEAGTVTYYHHGIGDIPPPVSVSLERPHCAQLTQRDKAVQTIRVPMVECGDCPLTPSCTQKTVFARRLQRGPRDFGWLNVAAREDKVFVREELVLLDDVTEALSCALNSIERDIRYRAIFEHSHSIMLIIHPQSGQIYDANPAAVKFYGWSHAQLCEKNIKDINTLSAEEVQLEMIRAKAGERIFFNFRHRRANGTVRDVEVYCSPIIVGDQELLFSVINDVAERKYVETALAKSQRKMTSIFRAAPVGIGVVRNRVIQEVNDRLCQICGYSKEELVGKNARLLYPTKKDYDFVGSEKHRQVRETGIGTVETRFQRKDGRIIDILMSSTYLDPEDKNAGLTFTALDITKRKRAERGLRESEQRLRIAGKAAYDLIYEWNLHSDRLEWFGDIDGLLGYVPGQVSRNMQGWQQLIHPDDCQRVKETLGLYRSTSTPHQIEYRICKKDGSYRYWRDNALPVTDNEGNLLKWVGVCTDITEAKLAEENLVKNQIEIDAIYQNAPLFMLLVDHERRVHRMNGLALAMSGRIQEEVVGLRGGEAMRCFIAHDDPKGCGFSEACKECKIRNAVRDTFRTGSNIQGLETQFPYMGEGEVVYMWVLVSTVYLPLPRRNMVLVCMQDITTFKESEARRANLEIQFQQAQKMESVGRLAGGVAHDLNNLLTPILGYGEMLVEDFALESSQKMMAEQVVSAGDRAKDLIRQLLAFSRKQTLDFTSVDLNVLLNDFKNLLTRTIREDVFIAMRLEKTAPFIIGDSGQLEQVVMNLAVNGQDAMPQGGTLTISTSFTAVKTNSNAAKEGVPAGEYVVLMVTDTGCGMEEDVQKHIFEPFFTTKQRHEGTGLGLASVYGIIKQHGGYILVESELGYGASFRIFFPAFSGIEEAEAENEELLLERGGGETILLVEDDSQVRNLTQEILVRQGYMVLSAENGAEAIVILEQYEGAIHLLLTDVVMPMMNGRELFQRAVGMRKNIKVLYMSGYPDDVIAYRGVIDSDVHFIQKPFSKNELLNRVAELVIDSGQ